MNRELYKRYPCPAQGHLDITMKIDKYGEGDLVEHKLVGSRSRNKRVRVHTFKRVDGKGFQHEVKVTPRSPTSRWSEKWD